LLNISELHEEILELPVLNSPAEVSDKEGLLWLILISWLSFFHLRFDDWNSASTDLGLWANFFKSFVNSLGGIKSNPVFSSESLVLWEELGLLYRSILAKEFL
jgi:hypothetical protein